MTGKVVASVTVIGGVLVMAGVVASAGQRVVATLPTDVGDLATAKTIELVQDARVVLTGTFATTSEDKSEVERTATLTSSGGGSGLAEIEIERDGAAIKEEIELEAKGLEADARYSLQVDGRTAGMFTTTRRGTTELKLTRKK